MHTRRLVKEFGFIPQAMESKEEMLYVKFFWKDCLSEDVRRPLRNSKCGTHEGSRIDIAREGIYVESEKSWDRRLEKSSIYGWAEERMPEEPGFTLCL